MCHSPHSLAEVHISHYNRCAGWQMFTYCDGGTTTTWPWSRWVPITTVFGAIFFDVEFGE